MAKKEDSQANDSNLESESPYIQEESSIQSKTSWLSSRATKITAIAVGSSLALGAAFAGGAAAGQLAGGAPGGDFGMGQNGPSFDGPRAPHEEGAERGGREGRNHQGGPRSGGAESGDRKDHGSKSFAPPMQMPAPSSTATTTP